MEIQEGGGGSDKYPLFREVGGTKQKCPLWGVWIFSGTTHYHLADLI